MVEPLHWEDRELLAFLNVNKTELSCMENPQTFVSQLRDYSLISKDQQGRINRMKSKEKMREAVYNVLDFIETKHPKQIQRFWRCAFKETIVNIYPTLRRLQKSLSDGSFLHESALMPADDAENETMEDAPEKGEQEEPIGKRRKKTKMVMEDDEEPSTSYQVTPRTKRKTPKKPSFSSPLKKGEKGDIWTWGIFRVQLPVTCGELEGSLRRDRLARGEKCILVKRRWYSPTQFERLAGKAAYKNWKLSIRCMGTPLGKLIQDGHLSCTRNRRTSSAKKSLFSSDEETAETDDNSSDSTSGESSSDSAEEEEEDEEEDEGVKQLQIEARHSPHRVLRVECEDITALLHTKRFASGTCGRSIRTENSWLTPVDFVKEASCQTNVSWKTQIKCEGKPLDALLKAKILEIHSLLCSCSLCVPDSTDLDNGKNDDECWICRGEGTEEKKLVECDECPRSFHQTCHLPHIQDFLLDDGQKWLCTPCVFIQTLPLYPERRMDDAMSRTISAHVLHCQYLLLGLYRADESCLFKSDPCTLPKYSGVVREPMWIDLIADKLQDGGYQTVADFVSDVQQIFSNCAECNRENPEFRDIGVRMKERFVKELNTVLKITPGSS